MLASSYDDRSPVTQTPSNSRIWPTRIDVVGSPVSVTSVDEVADLLVRRDADHLNVVVANVHSVMTARRDELIRRTIESADIVTPDGMPLVWVLRGKGHREAIRVTGIDVMTSTLDNGRRAQVRHFFYGSTPSVLDAIVARASARFPGVQIAGTLAPPMGPWRDWDVARHIDEIRRSKADVVWVGLGMPKQELWMAGVRRDLPGVALVGVGAAFDWFAGIAKRAPSWMQKSGLEWVYRLMQNPARMWRRYLVNNPAFVAIAGWDLIAASYARRRGR